MAARTHESGPVAPRQPPCVWQRDRHRRWQTCSRGALGSPRGKLRGEIRNPYQPRHGGDGHADRKRRKPGGGAPRRAGTGTRPNRSAAGEVARTPLATLISDGCTDEISAWPRQDVLLSTAGSAGGSLLVSSLAQFSFYLQDALLRTWGEKALYKPRKLLRQIGEQIHGARALDRLQELVGNSTLSRAPSIADSYQFSINGRRRLRWQTA